MANGNHYGTGQDGLYRRPAETAQLTAVDGTMGFQQAFPVELPTRRSWFSRSWKWIAVAVASLLFVAAAVVGVFVFLGGREKTLYQWSVSERIEGDIRVERQLDLSKNVEGSPYRFTVKLLVTNVGTEELAEINLEEALPDILTGKGEPVFTVEPVKRSEDGTVVGWMEKALARDGVIEIAYYLDLTAELSEPQLRKIEEQFEQQKIKFIGVPSRMITCQACAGSGRATCRNCSGTGSTTCPRCGGTRTSTCSKCGGVGNSECSVCKGYGYYYECYICGSPWPVGSSSCSNCGSYTYYT